MAVTAAILVGTVHSLGSIDRWKYVECALTCDQIHRTLTLVHRMQGKRGVASGELGCGESVAYRPLLVRHREHAGEVRSHMAEPLGINTAARSTAPPPPSTSAAQQTIAHAAAVGAVPAGLVRVPLPPRLDSEERVKPRKAAAPMQPPREQGGGASALATSPLADGFAGASAVRARNTDAGAASPEEAADADFAAGRFTSFEDDRSFTASLVG